MLGEDLQATIQEAINEYMRYKFKQAGIPMIEFHIHDYGKNVFSIMPLFNEKEEISMRIKITPMLNRRHAIHMVSTSGSIEILSDADDEEKIFNLLSIEIFKVIAKRAAQQIHSRTGLNRDIGYVKRIDNGELMNVNDVTYIDFENLDFKDVNWRDIYCS